VYKTKGEKWKWLLNDLDYSLAYSGDDNVNSNGFDKLNSGSSVHAILFQKLMSNTGFKKQFKSQCLANIETYLSEDRIIFSFNKVKSLYDKEIESQVKRWRSIKSYEAWEESCQNNLNFLLDRREIYTNQLNNL